MPRAISPESPIDTFEEEVLYTVASLKADPDAQDLAADFEAAWLEPVDGLRKHDRATRLAGLETTAQRGVANVRIDGTCERFGDNLYLDVGKDRSAPRWKGFFPSAVSSFVRQPFADQVQHVAGWLSSSDPALQPYLADLTQWVGASKQVLDREAGLSTLRSAHRQRREAFAAAFTDARDALHDLLSARARERKLGRMWADAFFMRG